MPEPMLLPRPPIPLPHAAIGPPVPLQPGFTAPGGGNTPLGPPVLPPQQPGRPFGAQMGGAPIPIGAHAPIPNGGTPISMPNGPPPIHPPGGGGGGIRPPVPPMPPGAIPGGGGFFGGGGGMGGYQPVFPGGNGMGPTSGFIPPYINVQGQPNVAFPQPIPMDKNNQPGPFARAPGVPAPLVQFPPTQR